MKLFLVIRRVDDMDGDIYVGICKDEEDALQALRHEVLRLMDLDNNLSRGDRRGLLRALLGLASYKHMEKNVRETGMGMFQFSEETRIIIKPEYVNVRRQNKTRENTETKPVLWTGPGDSTRGEGYH